ncbi:TPA: hypothetical protein EYO12_03185 [Candidatus Saccharibacteria bacterium]|nr:hypothetical protein [Candidatus Saccharibacteria bacterium]HIO87963.1 hypothetical protein [Candidatus Saccharibacteria bacterium]
MSSDFLSLFVVLFFTGVSIIKRVSVQTVLLVLLSSMLLGISFGPDLLNFLSSQASIFETDNAKLLVYSLLVFGPTFYAYWHFRGGGRFNPVERIIVSAFFAFMLIVATTNTFILAGFEDPFRNSYFANQLNRFSGLVTLMSFGVAFFEVMSQTNPGLLRARKSRRRSRAKK